jgi:hypothetical protein
MAIQMYGLTLTANGTSSAAYFSVNLATGGEFVQGGATIYPTQVSATVVSLYGTELAIESPAAAMMSGGATLTTTENLIAGRMVVSPAINVDTVLTLFGTSQIGSVTLKAGETVSNFSFDVNGKPGIPDPTAKAFLDRVMPKKP